jgi:hypothetical protein
VDIGGVTGVITEIVKHSVKLRTPEGQLMSFNAFTLCKLYAPAPRSEPAPPPVEVPAATGEDSEPEEPEQEFLTAPDFTQPLQPVGLGSARGLSPRAFGAHVDLGSYSGVVVQVVRQLQDSFQEGDLATPPSSGSSTVACEQRGQKERVLNFHCVFIIVFSAVVHM